MLESLLTSRWGGYVVMLLILGGITWLLRFLFGPKGVFRDPQWDASNAKMRQEEAEARAARIAAWHAEHRDEKDEGKKALDIRKHEQRFAEFTDPYLTGEGDGPLRLKVVHSARVLEHVRTLVEQEEDVELARAALLAALYHDCGRFPQFQRYQTFQDSASANHARLSLRAIRSAGLMEGETQRVRHLASTAILMHNRYALPEKLAPEAARITYMVRDADKLDILRVMVQHLDGALPDRDAVLLSVQDEAGSWTPKVLEDVLAGRVARYGDLRYVNDFRLLLGTWLYELRFESTSKAMWELGLMDAVLAGLPQDEAVQKAVAHLRGLRGVMAGVSV